jgi:FkbM family methyltransferase
MNAHIAADGVEYTVVLTDENDRIQSILAQGSPYEQSMLRSIVGRADGLIVDAGANIGNHSLYLAAHGYEVVAFEPDPVLAIAIAFSAELNRFDNIRVEPFALGSAKTTARIVRGPEGNIGAQSLKLDRVGVPVVPLDEYELSPSVIKIDVEGMEMYVLAGAKETIARSRPFLYVEAQGKKNYRRLMEWAKTNGYVRKARFNHTPTYLFVSERR